jgi:Glucose-6-phosphate dehydrogenase, NAD binding domain
MLRVAKITPGVGPHHSQAVVLVGATGDLSRRKLLPGLFYLSSAGFIPNCRIIGVALDQIDADGFRKFARAALDQFSSRNVKDADWAAFAERLDYVPIGAGADRLKAAAAEEVRQPRQPRRPSTWSAALSRPSVSQSQPVGTGTSTRRAGHSGHSIRAR